MNNQSWAFLSDNVKNNNLVKLKALSSKLLGLNILFFVILFSVLLITFDLYIDFFNLHETEISLFEIFSMLMRSIIEISLVLFITVFGTRNKLSKFIKPSLILLVSNIFIKFLFYDQIFYLIFLQSLLIFIIFYYFLKSRTLFK